VVFFWIAINQNKDLVRNLFIPYSEHVSRTWAKTERGSDVGRTERFNYRTSIDKPPTAWVSVLDILIQTMVMP